MMQGLIPQTFIDEIIARSDIVEFIDQYVPLKKSGSSYTACCPFHHEKTPSFNVIAKKQFYHCFGCGASGNIISFVMNHLNQTFPEAIHTLADRSGMSVPHTKSDKSHLTQTLYQVLQHVSQFYQSKLKTSGEEAIQYLKQRGLSGEIARLYQIGYAPAGWHILEQHFPQHKNDLLATGMLIQKEDRKTYDRYRHRIMFPIHDRQGRIIGFGGRVLDNQQKPKYLNSPETSIFQKSRELYGLHQIIQNHSKINTIIIVEGYLDVIALAQFGINNAVATLGTSTSVSHIQLLNKYTKQITFCFDGDNAGRQAAWRAMENSLEFLDSGLDIRFVFLPEAHDPDSLIRQKGPDIFLQHIQQAIPLHQFFLTTLAQTINNTSLAGKSQLIHAAKPYLQKMTDSPYKQLIIDELACLTRIENHRIYHLLDEKTQPENHQQLATNITRTPLRIAVALLLQHPHIFAACANKLPELNVIEQNQPALYSIIEYIQKNPSTTPAHLIENWRGLSLFDAFSKIATWDHQVPEQALEQEFLDVMHFLIKQNQENKIQELMQKARENLLTESERRLLQDLLKNRHKNFQKTL